MTKPYHPGKAAADGIQAALLAERGFTGPDAPLEGPLGFARISSSRADFNIMLEALGDRWELKSNAFKPYACGIVSHAVIDAALELRTRIAVPADIVSVEVEVHPVVLEVMGQSNPKDGLSTKFSVRHCFAVGLIEGAGGPIQFSDSRAQREDIVALRERMTIITDRGTPKGAARVVARMANGMAHDVTVENASGSAERPLTDAELHAKAESVVRPVLGPRTDAFLESAFLLDSVNALTFTSQSLPDRLA
jgi:2-methylcitrate dehydratase PrpD